ncbi:MHYT domain-containing protein [Luteipulveratus sp. YIM 133132]|uniref:MHYT domain-containing protein n=1 Tax=Luteipulveratus flavus TaxID=3031728 RepID=UPI0023AF6D44|nr:MHYT domain-containing protein [Luteipulveratus sp. YIM 133132]MDE9364816.1 MHYT domain-containing protein [Luteipulveratus sp. YIM 133132]
MSTVLALAQDGHVHGHDTIHHFELGAWIPALAYLVSFTGSVVGLACARQATLAPSERLRRRWQGFAATSIGGVAIWLMHFIAMLGMAVPGTATRYQLGWTIGSALLAVGATFAAFRIIGPRVRILRLLGGGLVMGLAVNLMHYVGMYALHIQGDIAYDPLLVGASIAIAVVAATVALWFTLVLRVVTMRILAGLVMGVAVVGMHYTGMAAMRVTLEPDAPAPTGLDVFSFLFPVFVIGLLALAIPITAVMMAPDPEDPDLAQLIEEERATRDQPRVGVLTG